MLSIAVLCCPGVLAVHLTPLSVLLHACRSALKMYSRARDYCTSTKHLVELCKNAIRVSLWACQREGQCFRVCWAAVCVVVLPVSSTVSASRQGRSAGHRDCVVYAVVRWGRWEPCTSVLDHDALLLSFSDVTMD